MKVLVIEDHAETAEMVRKLLGDHGILSDICEGAESALQIARFYQYDVVLIDLVLPDMDGFTLLQKLRDFVNSPVLILSGQQAVSDKVKTLGFGADDYMTKPFNGDELVARIKALARRSEGHSCSIVKVGQLTLNLDHGSVEVNGVPLQLTGKEYKILECLMKRKGITITKTSFLDTIYNGIDEPEEKIIDVFVCKIRKKLQDLIPDGRDYIETIWGRGYVLREPVNNDIQKNDQEHVLKQAAGDKNVVNTDGRNSASVLSITSTMATVPTSS